MSNFDLLSRSVFPHSDLAWMGFVEKLYHISGIKYFFCLLKKVSLVKIT